MDIEDIHLMIRVSIKTHIAKLIEQRQLPPQTFDEFNFLLREVASCSDIDHDMSYKIWENISLDMENVCGKAQRINEWNDLLRYYVLRTDLTKKVKQEILKHLTRKYHHR